ncbi:MAG: hypothetical protein H6744_07855 [Deltaproteobacteria bacterium]|nr:hypothetical protein [Deltaproteobacteria bacterium]
MPSPRSALGTAALLALLASAGCSSHASYVKSDDTALGRVVVYRNGIAYYERHARANGGVLALQVPDDKVDDFLKSLRVTDAATGAPIPVSYPTRGATHDATVEMAIQLPPDVGQDVVITYITEAPAWKPSYRVVVGEAGKVEVQGYAIVDNTSGEDWRDVLVGVGSSSALSFRYDLRSVLHVARQELQGERRFAQAPPTGGATHGGHGEEELVLTLGDDAIPRPEGHPDMLLETAESGRGARVATRKKRGDAAREPAASSAPQAAGARQDLGEIVKLAAKLRSTRGQVVLEGYAAPGDEDATGRAMDRANVLRNHLIEQGVAPARLQVVARGNVPGKAPGVEVKLDAPAEVSADTPDDGAPVGESHFESKTAMTIARGTSAMVSILDSQAQGDIVYVYTPDDERGNQRFAFKAVRLVNPTKSTLETGPVTVYGEGRFVGEGMTTAIPPGATAVIPFALDRQIVVEREGANEDRIARLLTLQRGVFTAEVQHARKTTMHVTNRMRQAARVFVRHEVREGWTLKSSPEVHERLGESYLFEVPVPGGATVDVVIEETTPLQRTVDLRSDVGMRLVRVYLEAPPEDARFAPALAKLVAIHDEMVNHEQNIVSLHERMDEFRVRIDELHMQIASLKASKVGGSLMSHLQKKMKEMSEHIQRSTIAVVDHEEQLMMARIRFQDAVAELSLGASLAAVTP